MGIGRRKARPGKVVVDWRDAARVRHYREFPDTREGQLEAQEYDVKVRRLAKSGKIVPDERTTFGDYFDAWLKATRYGLAKNTIKSRETSFGVHLIPAFGRMPLIRVNRSAVRQLLAGLLEKGYAPGTVHQVLAAVGSMFSYAVDNGDLDASPVADLGRRMKLGSVRERVLALSLDELGQFLAAAREGPDYHTFAVLAFAGVRISEARGLRIGDISNLDNTVKVERQMHDSGEVAGLKTKFSARVVEIPSSLCGLFRDRASQARRGPWLLVPEWRGEVSGRESQRWYQAVLEAMKVALSKADLPSHFSPHSLRHTFCRLHLEAGRELLWVSRQMGHSSIQITADRYGMFAQLRGDGAADALAASVEGAVLRSKVTPIR